MPGNERATDNISLPHISELYSAATMAGALLCGVGGVGFLLMVVPPEGLACFDQMMKGLKFSPIAFDVHGSTILTG